MKYVIILLLLASTLGCDEPSNIQTQTYSFLIDRTEKNTNYPTGSFLLERVPITDPNNGLELCLTNIGDTPYITSECFLLDEAPSGIWANEDARRKQMRLLKTRFTDSLAVANSREYAFERSDIFRPLVRELIRLTANRGRREVWLFSDLKEHSFFSVYERDDLSRLSRNLESVASTFEHEVKLPDNLSGITLRIIHSPTVEDTQLFTNMVTLYRKLLEPKGVVIHIGLDHQIHLDR